MESSQRSGVERREELAGFLRSRRERLSPPDVGLPGGARRRTPGLRREEVAQLAGLSVTWYTRLEQGRDIRVSAQVLDGVARALRLSQAERAHRFMLAHHRLPPVAGPFEEAVSPAVQHILDALEQSPAYVVGRRWDILAWNEAAVAFFGDFGDFGAKPEGERNLVWLTFADPAWRRLMVDWEGHARCAVAQFRASYARYTGDPWFTELIENLKLASALFDRVWSRHDVLGVSKWTKDFDHPIVGEMVLEQVTLQLADDPDVRVLVHTSPPDSDSADKLRRLGRGGSSAVPSTVAERVRARLSVDM